MSETNTALLVAHIVAVAQNGTIGTDNDLPWSIPEDMQFFKDTTRDHIVITGRKNYEAMGRPLPKRMNIIITRQEGFSVDGAHVVPNIDEAIKLAKEHAADWGNEIYIIGGGEIYRQTVDIVDTIYLTRIHQDFDGQVSYDDVDPEKFSEVQREAQIGEIPFTFVTYKKRT